MTILHEEALGPEFLDFISDANKNNAVQSTVLVAVIAKLQSKEKQRHKIGPLSSEEKAMGV